MDNQNNFNLTPFPKSLSLQPLSKSNLYNRRKAASKDNISALESSEGLDQISYSSDIEEYEELEWSVVQNDINPKKEPNNYYDENSKNNSNINRYTLTNVL